MVDQTLQRSQRMTPLWVISLFVSLTEVVASIAVTQASGGVQAALTAFVIAFPLLVASAFFSILWFRPYVLYPPTQFSDHVAVDALVRAMSNRVEVVRADVEAEAEHLRAGFGLQPDVIFARLEAMENGFTRLLAAQENAQAILRTYTAERNALASAPVAEKTSFEENAAYRIQVVEICAQTTTAKDKATLGMKRAEALSKELARAGFRTTAGAWNRDYYLNGLNRDPVDTVYIVHRGDDSLLARLHSLARDLVPGVPVKAITFEAATDASRRSRDQIMEANINAAFAYRYAA